MTEIREVAQDVYRLEVVLPAMDSVFGIYVLREAAATVIEPGPAIAVHTIQRALEELGIKELAYIVPTHLHVDHAGGIGELARLNPGAAVLVHPLGARHAVDPARLIKSFRAVWGDDFEASFGPVVPVPRAQVRAVEDGEVIVLNGRQLEVLHAPGHAPHQIVVFDRKTKGIFCGDALGMLAQTETPFPLPNTAPPNFDQDLYLGTIDRLRQLGARMLYYSHGGVEHTADTLITLAAENTRVFGDMTLEGLRDGATPQVIARRIGDYVSARYGLKLDEAHVQMVVHGHVFYFQQMGMP